MPYAVVEALSALTAVGLIGTFVLLGMRMRMRHKETLAGSAGREELDRLADSVDHLNDQVEQLSADTTELQERLDFAERLLTAPEEPAATPTPT